MSKDVDRNKVFQTTRVRTALRKDVSWIHQPKEQGRDKAGTTHEAPRLSFKGTSYVLLAIKKFESIDSSVSPPPQNTEVIPTEGNAGNQAQKDAQPEGTRMETTGETEPHAPTGELLQKGKAQAEKLSADTTVENMEEYGDAAADRSNVETFAEVSADVHVEEPVSLAKESPEAVSPVEPAEQPLSSTAAEIKEHVDTPADPSNAEQNEAKVSADANLANPVADVSAVDSTVENKAAAKVELECEEKSFKTETSNATNLGDEQVEGSIHPREGCEDNPDETTEDIVVYATKVMVDMLPETTEVNNTTIEEEASLHASVESVPDILVESVTKTASHPAAESESSEKCPQEDAKGETVAAAAKIIAELLPEATVVNNTTPGEDTSLQACVETVPDLLVESISKLPTPPADEIITEENGEKCAVEQHTKEPPTDAPSGNSATPEETPLHSSEEPVPDTQLKLNTESAAETMVAICEKTPEQNTQETVEAAAVANVEPPVEIPAAETEVRCEKSPPEDTKETVEVQSEIEGGSLKILTVSSAVSGKETSLQNSEVSDPETQLKPATEPATETSTEICCEPSLEEHMKETTEVPADVELESSSETSAVTTATQEEESALQTSEEPATDTQSELHPQPAAETGVCCENSPLEEDTKETVEASGEEESAPETRPVNTATPEETTPQNSEEPLLSMQPKLVTEPGVEMTSEVNCEKSPDHSPKETIDSTVVVDVASTVEIPTINTDEAALQKGDDSVHDSQYSPAADIVAETGISGEKSPPEVGARDIIDAVVEISSPPETPPVNNTTQEKSALQSSVEPVHDCQLKLSTEPSAETTTAVAACEKSLEQDTKEAVEAVAEIEREAHENPGVHNTTTEVCDEKSPEEGMEKTVEGPAETETESPEVSAVKTATTEEETCVQSSEETLPDTQHKLVAPPAVEIEVSCEISHPEQGSDKTAEAEVDMETSHEISAETTAAPVEDTASSEDPVPVAQSELISESVAETAASCEKYPQQQSAESTADHVEELNIEDALDRNVVDRALELTDALDVKPPPEIAPKPEEDPKESPTEESIPNHSDVIQKPEEEMHSTQTPREIWDYKSTCLFCDQIINGNMKITFSEPPINCHPECLKCGVCACALGDLLTPMFLHDQVIQCDSCYRKTLKTNEA